MTQEHTNGSPDESPEIAEIRGKVIAALKGQGKGKCMGTHKECRFRCNRWA